MTTDVGTDILDLAIKIPTEIIRTACTLGRYRFLICNSVLGLSCLLFSLVNRHRLILGYCIGEYNVVVFQPSTAFNIFEDISYIKRC